ncbi:hypothetical protein [Pseudomonas viridiflava]|uniref:hypothetical protein n=1 Tax=Pseudomonas viridiflava TaxID=33069 RepID=UPI002A6B28A5|nr:hypothetical protein [Pseudomonas viridiflava]MDY0937512.1 hypothetical protein [Pseudomonas viridiflava]MDY1013771.1 hypothetical protein [Pseudomonas viridiflava]
MTTAQQPLQQNLPPPVVAALLPNDSQWDERDLLPTSAALISLPVSIPVWTHIPISGLETIVRLYWVTGLTQHLVEERKWDSDQYPVIPVDQLLFEVPVILLVQGLHEAWYELVTPNGDINASDGQPVSIDLTPPVIGVVSPLVFDTDTITEQYLFDNGGQAVAQVPVYNDFKPGDVIVWYWSSSQSQVLPSDEVARRTLLRGESQPLSLAFPGEEIVRRGDGDRFAFYRLRDRAGNETNYSERVKLAIKAQPVPRLLPSPTVAEAAGSSTSSSLDPYRARSGATVVIPDTAVFKPGDLIEVQWSAPGTYGAHETSTADATGKRFSVPPQYIPQHMGRKIAVYYRVSGNGPDAESDHHELSVQMLAGQRWPTVQCTRPGISSGRLSLASVDGYATFRLSRWMFMSVAQMVSLTLLSSGAPLPVLDRYAVIQHDIDTGYLEVDVQKVRLQAIPLGALNVEVRVSFDNGSSDVLFPRLNLTLEQ